MAVKATGSVTGFSLGDVASMSERIRQGTIEELTADIEKIYENAYDRWPKPGNPGYDSSRSRDASRYTEKRERAFIRPRKELASAQGLQRGVTAEEDTVRARIWNDVSYARFIKANSLGGRSAFLLLLESPMKRLAKRIAKSLGKRIAKELKDG